MMTVLERGEAPEVESQESCSPAGCVARLTLTVWG